MNRLLIILATVGSPKCWTKIWGLSK